MLLRLCQFADEAAVVQLGKRLIEDRPRA